MSTSDQGVPVRLLDKLYRFKAGDDQQQELQAAAQHLDQKMRQIRDSGKINGFERVAVMAALNLANELLSLQTQKGSYIDAMSSRIKSLQQKIEDTLSQTEQIEL